MKCGKITDDDGCKDMTIPHMNLSFHFQWGLGHIHFSIISSQLFPSFVNDQSIRSNNLLIALKLDVLLVLFIVFAFPNDKYCF